MENVRFGVLTVATMQSLPSGTQCSVVWCMSTNVSGEHIASIFRVTECAKQKTSMKQAERKQELVSCLTYSLTLKMEVIYSSETLDDSPDYMALYPRRQIFSKLREIGASPLRIQWIILSLVM
jgi:hypothetical protein